jgi:hypothetical protein
MFVVSFIEDKNVLLSQLLRRIPTEGEDLTIKGRKTKVASVQAVDEKTFHVHVVTEKVKKGKAAAAVDNSKKKKR